MKRTVGYLVGLTAIAFAPAAFGQDVGQPLSDEQRRAIEARSEELHQLAEELRANAMELIEMEQSLSPEVVERIERSVIRASRPMLGISIAPGDDDGPVDGVAVAGLTPGGPAADGGLRAGDVIVEFDGEELEADSSRAARDRLLAALADSEPGTEVDLVILRDGERRTVAVTPRRGWTHVVPNAPLAPRPPGDFSFGFDHAPTVDVLLSGMQRHWDGMELVELTPGLGRYFGTDTGLLVVRKPARSDMPIEEGDVIQRIGDREPSSVSQAMRILRSYDVGDSLEVEIMRDKKRRKLELTVPGRSDTSS